MARFMLEFSNFKTLQDYHRPRIPSYVGELVQYGARVPVSEHVPLLLADDRSIYSLVPDATAPRNDMERSNVTEGWTIMTNTFRSKIPNLYTGMISESRAYWNGRVWQELGNCVLSSVVKCPLCRDYPNINHSPCTCFYGAQPGLNQGMAGKSLVTREDMSIRYAEAAKAFDTSIGARLWYAVRHDWEASPDMSDRLAHGDDTCCMATCCGPSLGHCPMFWTNHADNAHGAYITGVNDPNYQPGPYLCSTTDETPIQWEEGPGEIHHTIGAHGTTRAEGSVLDFMYELAYGHEAWQKKVCLDVLGIEGELDITIDGDFPDFEEWAINL